MSNECLNAAVAALRAAGVYDYQIVPGAKHPQLRWEINGMPRFYVVAGTPGDVRSVANTRADIRRMLRADGLITAPEPAEPRQRRLTLEQRVQRLEQMFEGLRGK